MPTLEDFYRDSVSSALGGFQLVEEGLKTYIDIYYGAVRDILAGKLHFAFDQSDVQDAPLGRLLTIFSKICPNKELVSELRGLIKHRNQAAHQAFVCLYDDETSTEAYKAMTSANIELTTVLTRLLPQIHAEMVAVHGVLEAHYLATKSAG